MLLQLEDSLRDILTDALATARAQVEKDEARLEKSRLNEQQVRTGATKALRTWGGAR